VSEWLVVVILGIVEGITEFLPVSSTGHLLLVEQWLPIRQTDTFLVVIQSGAALAVLLVFQQRLRQLLATWREPASRDYVVKLAAAFVITALGGLVLKHYNIELPETATPVAVATLVGGVLFIVVERWLRERARTTRTTRETIETVSWSIAMAVGVAQLVAAVFPGTSRSGATILIALVLGLARPVAIEFSFLLGVPTLMAAGALKLFSALRDPGAEPMNLGLLALGTLVSALTAFASVRWLLRYVQSHTFEGFGWYRIALGAAVLATAYLW
jgi:undecaprenyl-diphosphatase